ncbi:MAG: sigma-70 family RNA polymerase sigma factor [Phycisphaeraceae bacterium]|nr:sigma-70 family RNA polymerase sigma factor [Phycisphaeraceae bacterium]
MKRTPSNGRRATPQPAPASAPRQRAASTDDLLPVVYDQLRALAGSFLRREQRDIMLEPSLLVHETYLRLARNPPESWNGPAHFFAVAASAMRKVLIDHARRRRALKRGFGHARVSFDMVTSSGEREVEMRELDEVITRLSKVNPRWGRLVELRFFAGLNHTQVAEVLGVSRKTIVGDWQQTRQWLADALSDAPLPERRAAAPSPEVVVRRRKPALASPAVETA